MLLSESSESKVYYVKIINPGNAGGDLVVDKVELSEKGCYKSVEVLKAELCNKFKDYTEGLETLFGFIAPGHGMKGKQEKMDTDKELETMYSIHQKKRRINLWLKCKPKSKKRASPDDTLGESSQSKRQNSFLDRMNEVDDIVSELKEKHGEKFTPVQLNCWAHMINTNKHDSLDIPPDKPFFGKSRKESVGVSPGKRISLRSECINQLDKWHQLKERGVISGDQYDELQKTILTDIKKF